MESLPLTSAESGMLQNVGHACIIWRIGLEADGKDIILVVSMDVEVFGPGLVML